MIDNANKEIGVKVRKLSIIFFFWNTFEPILSDLGNKIYALLDNTLIVTGNKEILVKLRKLSIIFYFWNTLEPKLADLWGTMYRK